MSISESSEEETRNYIRQRKAQMHLNGDPMGLTTGAFKRRPKTFPTQPTPERVARGKERGEVLDHKPLYNTRGEVIGDGVTKIVPQISALHKRKTISSAEYSAALQFCCDWNGAQFNGPAISSYGRIQVDGGGAPCYESDHVIDCRQRVYMALKSVPFRQLEVIAWIIMSMGDGATLYELGERCLRLGWFEEEVELPAVSTLSIIGAQALRGTLQNLCQHYRIPLPGLSPQARAVASVVRGAA